MIKINLLDNLIPDPIVSPPTRNKMKVGWTPQFKKEWEVTMCGCGHHPVNPKKAVYKQHNHWMNQQHENVEKRHSNLYGVRGTGASIIPYTPTYDFSGEDLEMSPDELRKFYGGSKK